jgi:hypothetical protein
MTRNLFLVAFFLLCLGFCHRFDFRIKKVFKPRLEDFFEVVGSDILVIETIKVTQDNYDSKRHYFY